MAQLQTVLQDIPGKQAYFLEVPDIASAAQLSVVEFVATEKMGEPNRVSIILTHPRQLSRSDYLNLDATFTIVGDDGLVRKLSGYIVKFSTIQQTVDYVKYQIVLMSHPGRLQGVTNTQTFQHLTTPQIIQTILRSHGIREHQMSFRLRRQYPTHLWRFQYQMTDFDFIAMLMQKHERRRIPH